MKKFLYIVCLMTINILTLIPLVQTDWLMECGPCKCKWNSGKKTADCKNTAVTNVPNGLSSELQVLDLSNNYVPEIQSNEFVAANLRNLHKLFIKNSTLKQLTRDSLKGLEILIELDLSFNLLKVLPRSVFNSLVKLRALMLNNNKIELLEDGLFRNLKFLHKIELKENALIKIESKAFYNLPVLTQIYLDGNRLNVLKRDCFHHLEKLTSLSLKLNPWNCTCELKQFRDFTFERNLYTPPTDCYYPENIRGVLWGEVSIDAFACRPKILYPISESVTANGVQTATINTDGENATLVCRLEASPNTIVTWTMNRHALTTYPKRIYIRNTSEVSDINGNIQDILISELIIIGIRKTDEGTYTCSAENAGGKSEIDIQLFIGRYGGNFFITNQMMMILCLVAVGLLIVSMMIMIFTCCYCKKIQNFIKNDSDEHCASGSGMSAIELANGNGKKQFKTIKMDSLGGTVLIGNGNVMLGNTKITSCDMNNGNIVNDAIKFDNLVTNGGGKIIGNDEKEQYTTNEFIQANVIESDVVDETDARVTVDNSMRLTSETKFTTSAEKRHRQKPMNESKFIPSPSKSNYNESDHHQQNSNQYQISSSRYHSSDSHLPPDLLPHGQHQPITIHNNVTACSSTKQHFISSSPTLNSNKHITFASSFDDDINHGLIINNDYRLNGNHSNDVIYDKYLNSRRTSDDIDLRIYDTDKDHRQFFNNNIINKKQIPTESNAPTITMTTNTRTVIATGKTLMSPNRTIDPYNRSLSSSSTSSMTPITNDSIGNSIYAKSTTASQFYNINNTTVNTTKINVTMPQQSSLVKLSDNGGTNVSNCKPRQSIVRTSTAAFSFLSTGYNQQHHNFL